LKESHSALCFKAANLSNQFFPSDTVSIKDDNYKKTSESTIIMANIFQIKPILQAGKVTRFLLACNMLDFAGSW
jgi:hypothetical protein